VFADAARDEPGDVVAGPGGGRPAAGGGPLRLWVSAELVPRDGHVLAAAVLNPTDDDATFGVGGMLDRWDGSSWAAHRQVGFCISEWRCGNHLDPLDAEVARPAIGLAAPPHGVSTLLTVRIEGLELGWYRLRIDTTAGMTAAGSFEVVDDAPGLAPDGPTADVALLVDPAVAPRAGGAAELAVSIRTGTVSAEDYDAIWAAAQPQLTFERWDGSAWRPVAVASDVFDRRIGSPSGAGPLAIELPDSEAGPHRVVMPRDGGDALIGRYWVVDDATLQGVDTAAGQVQVTVELRDPPLLVEGFDFAVRFVEAESKDVIAERWLEQFGRTPASGLAQRFWATFSLPARTVQVDSHLTLGIGPGPRRPDFGGEPDGDGVEPCSGSLDLSGGEPRTLVLDWDSGCLAE
jgi:hypothetical protein